MNPKEENEKVKEKREKESKEREQRVIINQFQEMMKTYHLDHEKLVLPGPPKDKEWKVGLGLYSEKNVFCARTELLFFFDL